MTVVVERVPFSLLGAGQESSMPSFFQLADPHWSDPVLAAFYAGNHQRNWWHFQASIPALPPDASWMVMFTSILGLSVGKTGWEAQIGLLFANNHLFRAYSVDSPTPQVVGTPLAQVYALDSPPSPSVVTEPYVLIGQTLAGGAGSENAASVEAWEEYWLTEGIGESDQLGSESWHTTFIPTASTVPLANQRNGPPVTWLEPAWHVPVAGGNGGYFVRPFPSTVDYWFAQDAFTRTGDFASPGPGAPANPTTDPSPGGAANLTVLPAGWDFPLLELIIVACEPTSTVTGKPGPPGVLCHDGPLGVGVGSGQRSYSLKDLVYLAASVGCFADVPVAASVAMAESGGDPLAQGQNAGPPPSIDRGLWQINSLAHPEVSDQCAYNPVCCARSACAISSGGTDWTPWSTFNNGAYLTFLAAATAIFNAMG